MHGGLRNRIAALALCIAVLLCVLCAHPGLATVLSSEVVPMPTQPDASAFTATPAATGDKVVYLTFDDGPGARTPELLALLDALNVKATFFLIGRAVNVYPNNARAIYEAGHAIGSHSFNHSRKTLSADGGFRREMRKFNEAMEAALGEPLDVRLFRFPYGSRWATRALRQQVRADGYLWIDWNALNEDANIAYFGDTDRMMQRALETSGSKQEIVFLMHEGKKRSMEMLPALVDYYRKAGYVFEVLTPALDHEIPDVNMGLPKPTAAPALTDSP